MIWFALAVDLAAITVLSYVLYFRRHGRRDLVLAYVALNVGIFAGPETRTESSRDATGLRRRRRRPDR